MKNWAPVLGFEGKYQISSDGDVWSHPRGGKGGHAGKLLTPWENTNGYLRVALSPGDGTSVSKYIHRLVLEAFIGPRPSMNYEARHLDGNRRNNQYKNLSWGTRKENQLDRAVHGTSNRGERCAASKLTEQNVLDIRHLLVAGLYKQHEIASRFGVHRVTISKIATGETWKHSQGGEKCLDL